MRTALPSLGWTHRGRRSSGQATGCAHALPPSPTHGASSYSDTHGYTAWSTTMRRVKRRRYRHRPWTYGWPHSSARNSCRSTCARARPDAVLRSRCYVPPCDTCRCGKARDSRPALCCSRTRPTCLPSSRRPPASCSGCCESSSLSTTGGPVSCARRATRRCRIGGDGSTLLAGCGAASWLPLAPPPPPSPPPPLPLSPLLLPPPLLPRPPWPPAPPTLLPAPPVAAPAPPPSPTSPPRLP